MAKQRKVSPQAIAKARMEILKKKHPFYTYKAAPTAAKCIEDPSRHRLIDGPNGAGKTYTVGWETAAFLINEHPFRKRDRPVAGMLFCLSRNQAHAVWRELLLGKGAKPGFDGTVTDNRGLIPHWMIRRRRSGALDIAWDSSAGRPVPKKITMIDGSTLDFFWHGNKNQWKQIQGTPYDFAIIDEAGEDTHDLLAEVEARFREALAQDINSGWMLWGATDTTANEDFELWKERGQDHENPQYSYFHIKPGENPIMTKEVREAIAAGMDEDEAAIRVHGTRSRADDLRILPQFDKEIHVLKESYIPTETDNVFAIWDPGLTDDSAMLLAHTNRHFPHRVIITKFLTQKNSSVAEDAEMLVEGLGEFKLRAMIFDKCGARKREKSSHGKTLIQMMADALLRYPDIWANGPAYVPPAGQIHDQVQNVIMGLTTIEEDGRPRILVDRPQAPNESNGYSNGLYKFIREVANWRKKTNAIDKELRTGNIHQKLNEGPDTLRYLVTVDPGWVDYGTNGFTMVERKIDNRSDYQKQLDMAAERKAARAAFFNKVKRGRARIQDLCQRLSFTDRQ